MVKEEYNHAEGSPVLNKTPENSAIRFTRLTHVFHFDLDIRRYMINLVMYQYFKDHDNHLYRNSTPVAVIQSFDIAESFEKHLMYFVRKVRKYIDNDNVLGLTKEEAKQIRLFLRNKYKKVMKK